MDKFFPASAKHAKTWEFLELKQGSMIMLKYIAKFTELAHFGDDYLAIDMAKVRKVEDGMKLSIQGKIVGFLLQDMDSMVRTTIAIKREIEDVWSIRDTGASGKSSLLLVRERSRRLLFHQDFRDRAATIKAKARPGLLVSQDR